MPKNKDKDNKKKSPRDRRKKKEAGNDSDGGSEPEEVPKPGTKEFKEMVKNLGKKYSVSDKWESMSKKAKKKELDKEKKRLNKKISVEKKSAKKLTKTKEVKKKKKVKKVHKKIESSEEEEWEDELEEELEEESEEEWEDELEDESEQEEESASEYIPDDEDQEEVECEDEELDEEMEEYLNNMKGGMGKFNIIFTTSLPGEEFAGEYEDSEESDGEVIISSDDEAINTDNNSAVKKEKKSQNKYKKGDKVRVKLKDWDKYYPGKIRQFNINKKTKKTRYTVLLDDEDDEEFEPLTNVKEKYLKPATSSKDGNDIMKELEKLIKAKSQGGSEALLKKYIEMTQQKEKLEKEEQEKRDAKKKEINLKKFKKLLRGNSALNEFKYFQQLDVSIQKKIMRKMKEINDYSKVEKPHKLSLIEADIPVVYKATAMKKLETLKWMDPGSGEYHKTKQWVDAFMKIPFNKHRNLPVTLDDGEDKYNEFMEYAKTTLDEAVYGMDDAKMQIMQLVGQWISNPKSIGSAIAIGGPPGTGKTTLLKEGVSKILNRPFAFLALGGATDASFLEGHSYTYEGSIWGRVVDIIIKSKCMNPVIYFDELDKISNTPRGKEITGILTHLTDTTQNDKYHDKYFSGIDFDLSKVLFIFSYNDESKIDPILKDRMYRINTDGYKKSDKCVIAQKYLLPKINDTLNFKVEDIIIPDETIGYISENLIDSEKGVRNLKRALEIIYTKLNLYRLMKSDSKLFEKETTFKVEFPFTVTVDIAKKLVKKDNKNGPPFGMYV